MAVVTQQKLGPMYLASFDDNRFTLAPGVRQNFPAAPIDYLNPIRDRRRSGSSHLSMGWVLAWAARLLSIAVPERVSGVDVMEGVGFGGALDVLAGRVQRAPRLVQDIGLEWFFRTVQEPLRLGPRYLVTNAVFAGIVVKELASRLLNLNSRVHN